MADAWRELQHAIRELRKTGEIRDRLFNAYRRLVRLKPKDLPAEAREDFNRLTRHVFICPADELVREIRATVSMLNEAQLSEAVHRLVSLYEAVERYQPPVLVPAKKSVACRVSKSRTADKSMQPDMWESGQE